MLVNLSKTSIEIAINAAVAKHNRTVKVEVKWTKDRFGGSIAHALVNFDGLRTTVFVEEVDDGEWYVYLDGTLPVFTIDAASRPRIETPEEVDDLIALMGRARDLLASVRAEIERASEIERAAR